MTIRLDAVLEAVKLPARVANLAPSLADVDGDAFTLNKITKMNLSIALSHHNFLTIVDIRQKRK